MQEIRTLIVVIMTVQILQYLWEIVPLEKRDKSSSEDNRSYCGADTFKPSQRCCGGYRNNPLSAQDSRRNDEIAVIRAGGERPFATYKSHYGLARTRFMGLAKNMTAYGIARPELPWISAAKTRKWV